MIRSVMPSMISSVRSAKKIQKTHGEPLFSAKSSGRPLRKAGYTLLILSALANLTTWGFSQRNANHSEGKLVDTVHVALHPQEETPRQWKLEDIQKFSKWLDKDLKNQGLSLSDIAELMATLPELEKTIKGKLGDIYLGDLSTRLHRDQVTMKEAFGEARGLIQNFAANETNAKVMINQLEGLERRYEQCQNGIQVGKVVTASSALSGLALLLVGASIALAEKRSLKEQKGT